MIPTFITQSLESLGSIVLFVIKIFTTWKKTRGHFKPCLDQTIAVIRQSFLIVCFAGLFIGGILTIQFGHMLLEYNAESFLGGLSSSALIREVGPLIISFLLSGKIGAYIAAELSTMRVTEQIDAIECLGTNSIQYLIIPRWTSIIVSSMILLLIGLLVSIFGSMLVAERLYHINPLLFLSSIPKFTSLQTLFSGFFKSFLYSTIVASVCCYYGYTATQGARGVGRAVTTAAVSTNLFIVITNYGSSHFLKMMSHLSSTLLSLLGKT